MTNLKIIGQWEFRSLSDGGVPILVRLKKGEFCDKT